MIGEGLVLSNQFLQISGLLPSENIYGFAEHEQPSQDEKDSDKACNEQSVLGAPARHQGRIQQSGLFSHEQSDHTFQYVEDGSARRRYTVANSRSHWQRDVQEPKSANQCSVLSG